MGLPVDERFIVEMQYELDVVFPVMFLWAMKGENGGTTLFANQQWTIYPFPDKSDPEARKRTEANIFRHTLSARELDYFPPNGIAIGDNGRGDRLILLPADPYGNQLGETIYVWLQKNGEIDVLSENFLKLKGKY